METSLLLQDTANATSSGRSFLLSADPDAAQQFAATLQQQLDDPADVADTPANTTAGTKAELVGTLRSGVGSSLRGEIANWLRTLQGTDGVQTSQGLTGADSSMTRAGGQTTDTSALLLTSPTSATTTMSTTGAATNSLASAQLLSAAAEDGSSDGADPSLADTSSTTTAGTSAAQLAAAADQGMNAAALLAGRSGATQSSDTALTHPDTITDAATDSADGQPSSMVASRQHAAGALQAAPGSTAHDTNGQHVLEQHGTAQGSVADAARSKRSITTGLLDTAVTADSNTLQAGTDTTAALASAETTVAVHGDPAAFHPLPDTETTGDSAASALPTTVQVFDFQGSRMPSAPGMNPALRSMGSMGSMSSNADRSSAARTAAHTSSLPGARSAAATQQTTDTLATANGAADTAGNSQATAGSSTAQFAWLERQLGQQFKPDVDIGAAVAGLAGDSSTAPQTVLSPEFDATAVQSLQQSAAVLRQGDTQAATRPALSQPFTLQSDVPAGTEGWSEDIGSKVSWLSEQKIGRAELTLHPAELGTLDITINNDDDRVTVSIVTRNEATRELLESSMPRLADLLRSNGMTLEQGSVSHQGSGQREGREAQQGSATTRQDGNGGTTQDELRVRQAFLRQGQIDHYV